MSIGSQAREQTLLRGVAMVATAAVVGGLAWSAGFVALREALHSPFGRPFSDVGAAFWIALPFAFAVPVVHVQFVLWIRDRVTRGATITCSVNGAGVVVTGWIWTGPSYDNPNTILKVTSASVSRALCIRSSERKSDPHKWMRPAIPTTQS